MSHSKPRQKPQYVWLFGLVVAQPHSKVLSLLGKYALSLAKQRANLIVRNAQSNHQNSHSLRGESEESLSNLIFENDSIGDRKAIISIERYRKLTGHTNVSDEVIVRRLHFIEGLCRYVARNEIKQYAKKKSAQ